MSKSVFSVATMCRQRQKLDLPCWHFYLDPLAEFKWTGHSTKSTH